MKYLIIIPTLNEEENITTLLEKIMSNSLLTVDVLVVDDNSSDRTVELLRNIQKKYNGLFLLERSGPAGLGRAYLAGFAWGLQRNYEVFIQMDADWSHNPQYLLDFVNRIKEKDFVIGSRYIYGGRIEDWKYFRKFISKVGNFYARFILGVKITDFTGGFNAWRAEVLRKIGLNSIYSDGYSFQIELKYRAIKRGFNYSEIPIVFVERKTGKSKMNFKIVLEALWLVPKLYLKIKKF